MASVAEAIGAAGSGDGWVRGDDLAAVSESRGASVGSEVSIRVASLSNGAGATELQVTVDDMADVDGPCWHCWARESARARKSNP